MATKSKKKQRAMESKETAVETIKHPLQDIWSFWLYTNASKDWRKNLVEMTSFETVEDYWCLYHHMKTPSELPLGQDYAVFKKGIRPMWEDPANESGGRWLISLDKKRAAEMDKVWLYMVLMVIGDTFDSGADLCGVVVNVRAKSKIGLWMKNVTDNVAILNVGRRLKQQLPISAKLGFHSHNSTHNIHTL